MTRENHLPHGFLDGLSIPTDLPRHPADRRDFFVIKPEEDLHTRAHPKQAPQFKEKAGISDGIEAS